MLFVTISYVSSRLTFQLVPQRLTSSVKKPLRSYTHTFETLHSYGWPNDCRMLPRELHTFWNYREDLSMENGLITKGPASNSFHTTEEVLEQNTQWTFGY